MSMITDNITSLFGQLNAAGTIIGLFALLVGCFGVANIMFVSVKERTQQIGIQKALGARNYFIVSQFLAEAVLLSILGGLFGLGLVWLSTVGANAVLASMEAGLVLGLSAGDALTGILVSAGIGLLAGIMPALQAARMNPVDAMRAR
jgi:putative ABC transport system permease protein